MSDKTSLLDRLAGGGSHLTEEESQELQKQLNQWTSRIEQLSTQNNPQSQLYNFPIDVWLFLLLKEKPEKDEKRLFKTYMRYLSEEMKLQLDGEQIFKRRKQVKILVYNEQKRTSIPHSLCNGKYKHVVVHGRAANVTLNKREMQEGESDLIRLSEVNTTIDKQCIIEYYKDHVQLPRFPKGLTLSEYLLQPPLQAQNNKVQKPSENVQAQPQPIIENGEKKLQFEMSSVGNIVFNHIFILQAPTVILSMPYEQSRPQINAFLRKSELCVYLNQTNLLQQQVKKNVFYRSYDLVGIHFVDEGEVDCNGRNIARGWVVRGKAKTAGHSWQFSPIFFFKYIAKNASVWKQFVHDMDLNGEIPFLVERLLEDAMGWKQNSRSSHHGGLSFTDRKDSKLPDIRSMSQNKVQELGRLRHWDQRINEISDFKREVLKSRLKELPKQFSPMGIDPQIAATIKPYAPTRQPRLMTKMNKDKSLASQRSISNLEDAKSNKSVRAGLLNPSVNEHVTNFLLTKEEENNRYEREGHHSSVMLNNEAPTKHFDLYRRESVLITSVLQRLSSLSELHIDEDQPIARHEFMNVRLIRQQDLHPKNVRVRPRYGRPQPSPGRS